jgi:hypothetical protein
VPTIPGTVVVGRWNCLDGGGNFPRVKRRINGSRWWQCQSVRPDWGTGMLEQDVHMQPRKYCLCLLALSFRLPGIADGNRTSPLSCQQCRTHVCIREMPRT